MQGTKGNNLGNGNTGKITEKTQLWKTLISEEIRTSRGNYSLSMKINNLQS